ncbi:threonine--tRNA ligase [Candidatus Parcubacteria bacterium]|nr:threonine--tRNA ligase [Candidatus Parcubacteria bacterium]
MEIDTIRHSLAHILAMAVQELYPGVKFGIGPAIDQGFYYDFDLPNPLSPADLPKIEKKMRQLIKQNLKFEKKIISITECKKLFKDQPYKLELIKELKKITIYQSGNFVDLCKGPHIKTTKEINPDAFKLTKIAGAYWRGDEKNQMLTRIYGIAFNTKKELAQYIKQLEEAEKRDHRVLGKKLDLFIFSDLIGKGLPLLTPKGAVIRQELEKFIINEETKRGYSRVYTPDLAKIDLYKKSGHWQHYKESMYPPINVDGEDYVLRPMACPHHFALYNSKPRSYRDLPIRYAEIVKQYRKEQSGELSGLVRVMCFSLVDAHIICTQNQVEQEFKNVLELIQYSMKVLGIKDYWYRFSRWDPKDKKKYIDNPKAWRLTQFLMKRILDKLKLKYISADGEAAFYGPKLDIQMRNVNGKEDTAFTVQIDFALPEKFGLTYTNEKGKQQRPMVIHRSSIGCIERTMAFLIEQYAGAFPLWLSPVQIWIIPIANRHNKYANEIGKMFQNSDFRFQIRDENETVGKKIREGEIQKIPYLLVVGDKEQKAKSISVRKRGKKDIEETKLDKFIEKITKEYQSRL